MPPVRTFTSSVLDPYERGLEFGAHHVDELLRTIAAYREVFRARALGPFDVELWARRAWAAIGDLTPWAVEEIRGIADGADVPVHEIAALNARTELLAIANPTGIPECSAVVSLPPGGHPVAAQTWDWYEAMSDCWLIWTIPFPDGRVVTALTEYGVLAKIGVSSTGLGVLFNKLLHASDALVPLGYPVHLLSRRILETAWDTGEAIGYAKEISVSASSAVSVVDRAGRAASLELFPGGLGVVEPVDGLLVRTNHFDSAAGQPGCLAATVGPGSVIRQDTLRSRLAGPPPDSADEVLDAMHDHAAVGGVCAHVDESLEPALRHATLATVVIDVAQPSTQSSLKATVGGPCARESLRTSSRT